MSALRPRESLQGPYPSPGMDRLAERDALRCPGAAAGDGLQRVVALVLVSAQIETFSAPNRLRACKDNRYLVMLCIILAMWIQFTRARW